MRRQRVFFFNRFFWPDESATAQILTDLCHDLGARRNLRITVVTSRLNYADPSVAYPRQESLGGVEVIRLRSTRFGRTGLWGRLADYLSIYCAFFLFIVMRLAPGDIAVFKTDPPLLSVLGALGRQLRGFQTVAWCQDVFPEVAMAELKMPGLMRWGSRWLVGLRNWSLRESQRVIVLGRDMDRFFQKSGLSAMNIRRIPNWSIQTDDPDADGQELRSLWQIPAESFVVGYSGNLGRAHDWKTFLAAADALRDEPHLLFLLCGGGFGLEQLREAVAGKGLEGNFRFLPYQPRERLSQSLRAPDIHWFTLKEQLAPFILPSKFVGILQAGRPVLFVGDPDSEPGELIRGHGLGGVVRAGDSERLAELIRHYKRDRLAAAGAGEAARDLWDRQFRKSFAVEKWNHLLDELTQASRIN